MRKSLPALAFSIVVVLFLTACNGQQPGASSVPEASTETSVVSMVSEPDVSEPVSSVPIDEWVEPVPDFLDEAGRQHYLDTLAAYKEFTYSNSGFGSSWNSDTPKIEKDGFEYIQCNGDYIRWDEFEAAMLALFTPELFEELNRIDLYTDDGGTEYERHMFIEQDGDLYGIMGGARGANISYIDHGFELVEETDEYIRFNIVGRCADWVEDKDGNWGPSDDITVEEKPLELVMTPAGWRYSVFAMAY